MLPARRALVVQAVQRRAAAAAATFDGPAMCAVQLPALPVSRVPRREGEGPVKPPAARSTQQQPPEEEEPAQQPSAEETHQASAVPIDVDDQDASSVADEVVDNATTAGG